MNNFISNVMSSKGSSFTENGAVSYASTGKELVDQFGKAASYRNRDFSLVSDDQERLWKENPEAAVRFPFYLRMITREVKLSENRRTEKVQRGAGARDESLKRILWLAYNYPDIFNRNAWVLPVVGSWKDLWTLMLLDESTGNSEGIDHTFLYGVMAAGLKDSTQCDLIRKYMPAIKSAKKCKTQRAKLLNAFAGEFAYYLGLSAKEYRKMKASGTAHDFQKLMCSKKFDDIDFNTIPGKALLNIVSGGFLKNHGLYDKYVEWIKSQPVVKFNGYPYELGAKLALPGYGYVYREPDIATKITVDKQFENLIATGKKNEGAIKGNVWCALDTSGSMGSTIPGSNVTAMNVALSLGIYFSTLNEGSFHQNVIMFDNDSKVKQLSGSFTEMWKQVPANAMGGTNFQSVINEIVRVRTTRPDIPLEDYPKTLLVVSDMQFNPAGDWWGNWNPSANNTNIEEAKRKLSEVFPREFVDDFKFIWWQVNGDRVQDMPSTLDDSSSYFFSGFDGSIISFLLGSNGEAKSDGTKPSAEEIIDQILNQEILLMIK